MSLNSEELKAIKEMSKAFKNMSILYENLAKNTEDLENGIITEEEFDTKLEEFTKELLYEAYKIKTNQDLCKFL